MRLPKRYETKVTSTADVCNSYTRTAEQGFGVTTFSSTLDDAARQRVDGAPQGVPEGLFVRLPGRQQKQQPALVTVNTQPAKVMSTRGNAPYTFEALVDLAQGDNTVTIEAEDGNGNVATQSYSVTAGGVQKTLEYDLNGNLRYEKNASGTVLREFQWDAKNRLVKLIDGTHETQFVYDGFDRRVRIVETDNNVEQSNHTYLWDSAQIVQRRDSTGTTIERSYFNNGFEESGDDYYYTKDQLEDTGQPLANEENVCQNDENM